MKLTKKFIAVFVAILCLTAIAVPAMAVTSRDVTVTPYGAGDRYYGIGDWRMENDGVEYHWYVEFNVGSDKNQTNWKIHKPIWALPEMKQWGPPDANGIVRFGFPFMDWLYPPGSPSDFYIYY